MLTSGYAVVIMGFNDFGSVKELILVPRNGYINRLQAMASSAILAETLGADFRVCWKSEPAAPAQDSSIFNLASFPPKTFLEVDEVERVLDHPLEALPRYVNAQGFPKEGSVVTFAGHDRGEQPLMGDLLRVVRQVKPETLVIVAGGRFSHLAGNQPVTWDSPEFQFQRASWYQQISFAFEIESASSAALMQPSLGLHLRYSDRSHQAPSRREVTAAVSSLVETTGLTRIFVASDSISERDKWLARLNDMGLDGWHSSLDTPLNLKTRMATAAMVDWRILSRTVASVFFKESSYGYEAAVASANFDYSIGLSPNPILGLRSHLGVTMMNVVRRFSR